MGKSEKKSWKEVQTTLSYFHSAISLWSALKKKPICITQLAHGTGDNGVANWITAIAVVVNTDLVATGWCGITFPFEFSLISPFFQALVMVASGYGRRIPMPANCSRFKVYPLPVSSMA